MRASSLASSSSSFPHARAATSNSCVCALCATRYKNAFKSDKEGAQYKLLNAMQAEAKRKGFGEWERTGVLKWDAMKLSEGIVANVFTGELMGIEWEDLDDYNHLALQLHAMNGSADAAPADEGATPPPAKPKVAKYWTEFFFSSVGAKDFSYSVFRVGTAELSAHDIVQMVMECCVATNRYGFNIGCTVCDGASEHRSFQGKIGTISSADVRALLETGILDSELLSEIWPRCDHPTDIWPHHDYGHLSAPTAGSAVPPLASVKVAFPHPVTRRPVFLMSDPVHLIKKLNSSLYKSCAVKKGHESQPHTTRFIVKYEQIDGEEVCGSLSLSLSLSLSRSLSLSLSHKHIHTHTHTHTHTNTPPQSLSLSLPLAMGRLSAISPSGSCVTCGALGSRGMLAHRRPGAGVFGYHAGTEMN